MDPIVTRFVDAALDALKRSDLMRLPGQIPLSMRDPSAPQIDDWVPWKPTPSTVTESQLDDLEREIGLRYPPPYRQFLRGARN
jgi:hypothetical protein